MAYRQDTIIVVIIIALYGIHHNCKIAKALSFGKHTFKNTFSFLWSVLIISAIELNLNLQSVDPVQLMYTTLTKLKFTKHKIFDMGWRSKRLTFVQCSYY